MAKEIGGYFELELPKEKEYHTNAIALNSGRNCLLYTIKAEGIRRIYYPFFNCETMLDAIGKYCPDVDVIYYHIDDFFKPILSHPLGRDDWLLFINYYGICSNLIPDLGGQIIVDNSQSFFTKPLANQSTFYSPRKFFGVPDGGYLYTKSEYPYTLEREISFQRVDHLLKRIDLSASQGYTDYKDNEEFLAEQPVRRMSRLTQRLLTSIDYAYVSLIRRNNFSYLHKKLSQANNLTKIISQYLNVDNFVPFVYPFMVSNGAALRQQLIDQKIYVPKYWPSDMLNANKLSPNENKFLEGVVPLPIDQRYDEKDMDRILDVINGKN